MAASLLGIMTYAASKIKDKEEMRYYKKLALEARKLDLQVVLFAPDDAHPRTGEFRLLYYEERDKKWHHRWGKPPELIYDRCRIRSLAHLSQKAWDFRNQHPHLLFLNSPLANKWQVYQMLSQHPSIAAHLPPTAFVRQWKDVIRFLKNYDVVYLKPINGTGGRGILRVKRLRRRRHLFIIEGRDDRRRIIPPLLADEKQVIVRLSHWPIKRHYIVQQGITANGQSDRAQDFRLLIQKNGEGKWEITGCAGRIGIRRSITSNLHGGGKAVHADKLLASRFGAETAGAILERIALLSQHTADALEQHFGRLCELGLDIAVDGSGHPWLLEVNPKPSREVFRKIGDLETYRKAITQPLVYALWLLGQKASN